MLLAIRPIRKAVSVIAITALAAGLTQYAWHGIRLGDTAMKTLLVGIAFAVVMVFTSQAFASELPDCPNVKWKNGHYICDEANS
jgi:hypothetical protein